MWKPLRWITSVEGGKYNVFCKLYLKIFEIGNNKWNNMKKAMLIKRIVLLIREHWYVVMVWPNSTYLL